MSHLLSSVIHQDKLWFYDETKLCHQLEQRAAPLLDNFSQAAPLAEKLIEHIRSNAHDHSNLHISLEELLQSYGLDNEEGIRLMALAEALIRIPDNTTADALIDSKLHGGHWHDHLQAELSPLLNATTRALLFAEQLVDAGHSNHWLLKLENKLGRPLLREALRKGIKVLGQQFVMGETLPQAFENARSTQEQLSEIPILFSFDMLGEAALCQEDVDTYFEAYRQAIQQCLRQKSRQYSQQSNTTTSNIAEKPSVSIKLSALHPRFEWRKRERVMQELLPRLQRLCSEAAEGGVSITLDAEEAMRLPLSQLVFEALLKTPEIQKAHIGMAVQAYGKRAHSVLAWLYQLAKKYQKRLPIRLVKGAYWDSEIKWAQQQRLSHYPIFTHRDHTDINYLACARFMLDRPTAFYPQFATHNALTLATIWQYRTHQKSPNSDFEFQRLHGMGESLYQGFYQQIAGKDSKPACRIYAPVGPQKDLLPYLIRRLLENGANSSFVHQALNQDIAPRDIIQKPTTHTALNVDAPRNLFPNRISGSGYQLNIPKHEKWITTWITTSIKTAVSSFPANEATQTPENTPLEHVNALFQKAQLAFTQWSQTKVGARAEILNNIANQLEEHLTELTALCVQETGKTLQNSLDDVREAVDFCRYYATQAQDIFHTETLPGITGERNQLSLAPRGTIICISPWNFPVAIFCGQIVAALVTGNCVIAKPAEQSPRIAKRVAELMHRAGVPNDVLQITYGEAALGQALVSHPNTAGVMFTGSTSAAKDIHLRLAEKPGPITPLVAETGGINAMICDSSALSDQVIHDVLASAFDSAGQRCSALRRLYLPEPVYNAWKNRLLGAMEELSLGELSLSTTDIGPLIDSAALKTVQEHVLSLQKQGGNIHQSTPKPSTKSTPDSIESNQYPPTLIELPLSQPLEREVFGPVLHITPYASDALNEVIDQINNTGYGLTLGIHSRNQDWTQALVEKVQVGNIYINRNIIGAEVGSQPFGGCGLSGTGPKAGGPHYLKALCREICVSENTAAIGGNTDLLSQHNTR